MYVQALKKRPLSGRMALNEKKTLFLMTGWMEEVCVSLRECITYMRDGISSKKDYHRGKSAGLKLSAIKGTDRTCYKKDTGKATYQ